MRTAQIDIDITLPVELVKPFLQMLRDFDIAHDPNHEDIILLQVGANMEQMTIEEARDTLDLQPGFAVKVNMP